MATRGTLTQHISRTFLLQAGAISLAAIVSVGLAAFVIKQVLVTEALRMEADYFWARYAEDPGVALPGTLNLTGYFIDEAQDPAQLPVELRGLADGYHDIDSRFDFTTVFVTTRGDKRLLLAFDGERVDELATYFGLVPLTVVLLVLYLSVWLAFRASHRAISPVAWLAREVDRLDPDSPDALPFAQEQLPKDANEEVRVLAAALTGLVRRLHAFVERERTFTRDASHELRTPLTVIRIATDVMSARSDLSEPARNDLDRIRRSASGMEELVEAFLVLAREAERGLPAETVCINDIVAEEIERLRLIARDKPVEFTTDVACRLVVQAPRQAVSAVVGNLLRNALAYTDSGQIRVEIANRHVLIEDSGIGMAKADVREAFEPFFRADPARKDGYGVGLTIVKRFTEHYRWPVHIQSRRGEGTTVRIRFPNARHA